MKTNLIYATSNPGKILEIGRHFGHHGLNVSKLSDFSPIRLDPIEDGITLGENARIKARAYAQVLAETSSARGQRYVIVADDTGVFIRGLGGEPGIKVRRWIGRPMTDEEIIDHALKRLKGKKGSDREAEFRTAVFMIWLDEHGQVRDEMMTSGELKGRIVEDASPARILGFPFESLFHVDEYGMLLGDLHRMPPEQKHAGGFYNHRERALEEAVPIVEGWMGDRILN